jgi:hypothetical protein
MISLNYVKRIKEVQDESAKNEYAEYKEKADEFIKTIRDMHDDLYAYAETIDYIRGNKVNLNFSNDIGFCASSIDHKYTLSSDERKYDDTMTGKSYDIKRIRVSLSFDPEDKNVYIDSPDCDVNSSAHEKQSHLDSLENFIKSAKRNMEDLEKSIKTKMYELDIPETDQEERDY